MIFARFPALAAAAAAALPAVPAAAPVFAPALAGGAFDPAFPVAQPQTVNGGPAIMLIDALMVFTPDRRCLHDHFAGTVVVKA